MNAFSSLIEPDSSNLICLEWFLVLKFISFLAHSSSINAKFPLIENSKLYVYWLTQEYYKVI